MQDAAQDQQQGNFQGPQQATQNVRQRPPSNNKAGEYIDFEEIK
jgi:hypothetical protein